MNEQTQKTAKEMILDSAAKTPEQRAQELFSVDGFCIIKRFLSVQEVRGPKDRYKEDRRLVKVDEAGNVGVSYFFKNKTWKEDIELFRAARRVSLIRDEILASPAGEAFRREYPWATFEPGDREAVNERRQEYHFIRAARIRAGDGAVLQDDLTGPVLGVILLSKKGVDYTGGGLTVSPAGSPDRQVDLDELSTPGDLILLDTRRVKYQLKPLTTRPGQIGRLELFFPLLRQEDFTSGRDYYFFTQNKLKLYYFQTPPLGKKIQDQIRHFQGLISGKIKALDEGRRQ